MKKAMMMLLIAFFALMPGFCSAILELENRLYSPQDTASLKITIEREGYIGTGTLQICLSHYDFISNSYSLKCDTLLQEHEVYVNNLQLAIYQAELLGIEPNPYRFCIIFKYKEEGSSKTMQTCSDKNFILIRQSQNSSCPSPNYQGVILSAITPGQANKTDELIAKISIENYSPQEEIMVLAYIKNQTHYINQNQDDDSLKIIQITKGSKSQITLKTKLIENASEGQYVYYIKAIAGEKEYSTANTIEIMPESKALNESLQCEPCECHESMQSNSTPIIEQTEILNQEMLHENQELLTQSAISQNQSQTTQSPKLIDQLNLKKDEYYYLIASAIGLMGLAIMYFKIK